MYFILLEVTNDLLQCNELEESVMDCRLDYSSCMNEENTDIYCSYVSLEGNRKKSQKNERERN